MKKILVLTFFALISGLCAALPSEGFPSLKPEEISGGLMEAALFFSDVSPQSQQGRLVLEEYAGLSKEVSSPSYMSLSERERGEAILTLMYEKVLDRYSLKQSSIEVMFREGTYNCVSSSVLYACLALDAGLTVFPQMTTDHAFCTILAEGKKIDVETTNPYGFNPGEKKYASADSNRYAVVPARVYSQRKECSVYMLVSLIAQNRASVFLEQKNYEAPVTLMLNRYAYVRANGSNSEVQSAFDGFLTACNNYALEQQRRGEYENALEWLSLCRKTDSSYWNETMQSAYDSITNNRIAGLLNSGNWQEAQKFLDEFSKNLSDSALAKYKGYVYQKYVEQTAYSLAPDQALLFLKEQDSNPLSKQKDVASLIASLTEYMWSQKIVAAENTGDHLSAVALADEALKVLPSSSYIKKIRQTCLDNYAVTVHNRFADLANSGRYEEALAVLDEGLSLHPSSTTLKRDRQTLVRMMSH